MSIFSKDDILDYFHVLFFKRYQILNRKLKICSYQGCSHLIGQGAEAQDSPIFLPDKGAVVSGLLQFSAKEKGHIKVAYSIFWRNYTPAYS